MATRDIVTLSRWAARRAVAPDVTDQDERDLWLLIQSETERYLAADEHFVEASPQVESLFDTPDDDGSAR